MYHTPVSRACVDICSQGVDHVIAYLSEQQLTQRQAAHVLNPEQESLAEWKVTQYSLGTLGPNESGRRLYT